MIPQDPEEMEASSLQLVELVEKLYETGFCNELTNQGMMGLIGGWAVHYKINDRWKEMFGRDYLQSRDIDVFFHCEGERLSILKPILMELRYEPHSNNRYLKTLSRMTNGLAGKRYCIVDKEEAKKIPTPFLIDHYIDLFCDDTCSDSNNICEKFHSWKMERLRDVYSTATLLRIFKYPIVIPDIYILLGLKSDMITMEEREPRKKIKDICDFIALTYHPDFRGLRKRNDIAGRVGHLLDALKWILQFDGKSGVSFGLYRDENVRTLDDHIEEAIGLLQ